MINFNPWIKQLLHDYRIHIFLLCVKIIFQDVSVVVAINLIYIITLESWVTRDLMNFWIIQTYDDILTPCLRPCDFFISHLS